MLRDLSGEPKQVVRITTSHDKRLGGGPHKLCTIVRPQFGFSNNSIFFQMDFGRFIQSGPGASGYLNLSALQILGFAENMLAAMEIAHERGIMHCDLKPQNLLVVVCRWKTTEKRDKASPTERVLKLCDFGVARQMREKETHLSAPIGWGTAKYMAPEMVHSSLHTDGRVRINFAVDVWSFGVILHQLLHDGHTPHQRLLEYGKLKVLLGISHERSARVKQVREEGRPRRVFGGRGGGEEVDPPRRALLHPKYYFDKNLTKNDTAQNILNESKNQPFQIFRYLVVCPRKTPLSAAGACSRQGHHLNLLFPFQLVLQLVPAVPLPKARQRMEQRMEQEV